MKYKVGDKVLVKSLDWYNKNKNVNGNVYTGLTFVPDMRRCCGKWFVIEYIENDIYKLKDVKWNWCDEFFEDIKGLRKNKLKRLEEYEREVCLY